MPAAPVVQISGQDSEHRKSRAELRHEHLVGKLSSLHRRHISIGAHEMRDVSVAPKPSTRDDASQAEPLTQRAQRAVERATDAAPPAIGMNVDVRQVERVATWVVTNEGAIVSYAEPRMRRERIDVAMKNERRNRAHWAPFHFDDELPFGKHDEMRLKLRLGPNDLVLKEIRVGSAIQCDEVRNIGGGDGANLQRRVVWRAHESGASL